MKRTAKNILYGIGSVLVEVPAKPVYRTLSRRDGFTSDRRNVRNDIKTTVCSIRKVAYSKQIVAEVGYGKK